MSPRLTALFSEVRRRVLPATARDRYVSAKAAFDNKNFKSAAAGFKELLSIVRDPDASGEADDFADMRQLAEGFLTLATNALAAVAPPAPAPSPAPAPIVPVRPTIFTADDGDVVPPADIEKRLPSWRPPAGQFARTTFKGLLEIVIDEEGRVEAATPRPVWATYDAELLKAASTWRFRPATRGGVPVKYRKLLEIVLRPQQ